MAIELRHALEAQQLPSASGGSLAHEPTAPESAAAVLGPVPTDVCPSYEEFRIRDWDTRAFVVARGTDLVANARSPAPQGAARQELGALA